MQQDNTTKNYVRGEATKRCFGDYAKFISELVIDKFGASFETQDAVRNSWRDTYEYRAEIEKFLIAKSNLFIKTLDSRFRYGILPYKLRYTSLQTRQKYFRYCLSLRGAESFRLLVLR